MSTEIISLHPVKPKSTDCPLCGEKSTPPHTPFCSKRCSQLDLGKWLSEAYFVPTQDSDEDSNLDAIIAEVDRDIPLS